MLEKIPSHISSLLLWNFNPYLTCPNDLLILMKQYIRTHVGKTAFRLLQRCHGVICSPFQNASLLYRSETNNTQIYFIIYNSVFCRLQLSWLFFFFLFYPIYFLCMLYQKMCILTFPLSGHPLSFWSLTQTLEHRWGLEQKSTGKSKALPSSVSSLLHLMGYCWYQS